MSDKPQLQPGEVIVDATGDTIKTSQRIDIYDAAQIKRMRVQRSHQRAAQLMEVAVDNITRILAQEGLIIDESVLTEMAYVPVGAAVHLALYTEGTPAQRGAHAHQVLSRTMEMIKNRRHRVIAHFQGVIKANAHLSPDAQDELAQQLAEQRQMQINAARAQRDAELKAASDSLAKAHPQTTTPQPEPSPT